MADKKVEKQPLTDADFDAIWQRFLQKLRKAEIQKGSK